VLVEAFHYRFHPAWQLFQTLYDPNDVEHVEVRNALMAGVFPYTDIRFQYSLSGGALMDYGCYAVSSLRSTFHAEPTDVTTATYTPLPEKFDKQIDDAMVATYTFPNGGTGKIDVNFNNRGGYWFPALTKNWPTLWFGLPKLTLDLKEKDGKKTQIIFHNYLAPFLYHRIDIITTTAGTSKVEYKKEYTWSTSEEGFKGEEWWTTYRFQLEAFVDRVKKRKGSGVWVEPEESIGQMETIDATYLKSGLPVRPTSEALE
jgi:predicted dehydrogenase